LDSGADSGSVAAVTATIGKDDKAATTTIKEQPKESGDVKGTSVYASSWDDDIPDVHLDSQARASEARTKVPSSTK